MKRPTRANPTRIARIERAYGRQLSILARHVGDIVNGFEPGNVEQLPALTDLLRRYAEVLAPWARLTAEKMIRNVNQRDLESWRSNSLQISEGLRREILNAPTGEVMRQLLDSQVELITSLPLDAAKRVHEWTLKGLEDGTRASEVAGEIMRTGEVTASRAMLIARTETSRTATALVQARAVHVGSEGYIWATSKDGDVRPSHQKMNGKFVKWDSPPTLDNLTGHAGALPNCRCFCIPQIPPD